MNGFRRIFPYPKLIRYYIVFCFPTKRLELKLEKMLYSITLKM